MSDGASERQRFFGTKNRCLERYEVRDDVDYVDEKDTCYKHGRKGKIKNRARNANTRPGSVWWEDAIKRCCSGAGNETKEKAKHRARTASRLSLVAGMAGLEGVALTTHFQ